MSPYSSNAVEEESKTASSGFPRMRSIPTSTRRVTETNAAARGGGSYGGARGFEGLYPEDIHSDGYNLAQALNEDPLDLHDMNESSALQRIL